MEQKNIIFGLLILFLASCTSGINNEFPYSFIRTKIETVNNNENKMDLYAYSGRINIDSLKLFCKKIKIIFPLEYSII